MKIISQTLYCSLALCSFIAQAKEKMKIKTQMDASNPTHTLAYNCAVGTAQTELNINNVRTTILNGGDMWWDLGNNRYEIPKGSGKHSMFAGALWIGGMMIMVSLRLLDKLTVSRVLTTGQVH